MQPYLFPYLGYFQLIQAVDTFVVYDDVQYIKGGWINRNYILAHGSKQLFTLPLSGASSNMLINQIKVGDRQRKIIQTIRQNYGKAPYFSAVFSLFTNIIEHPEKNLAAFLDYGLRQICHYLDLHPQWYLSSALKKDNSLKGMRKVLAICKELGCSRYINLPGGRELYAQEEFARHGIQLSFIQPKTIAYRQFGNEFVPNLSIIDVMMFNSREQCARLLEDFELS